MKIRYLLPLILLTGCANNKGLTVPKVELPSSWSSVANKNLEAKNNKQHWWQGFNDQTLNQLVKTAIADNQNLKIAKERLIASRAASLSSSSKLWPSVQGVASTSRGNPGLISKNTKQTIYQANFDASYEIDLFGGNTYLSKADKAKVVGAQAELDNCLISLIAELVNEYLNLRYYQESLNILQKIASSQQQILKIEENSNNAGVTAKTVKMQSSINYSNALTKIHDTEAQINESYYKILILLGKNPGSLSELLDYAQEFPKYDVMPILDSPVDVIRRRPDIKIAESKFFQAAFIEKAATTGLFPKISISALFGLQDTNLLKRHSIWQINTNLIAPILNWGQINSFIKTAKSQKAQAAYEYKQAVTESLADVETKIYANLKQMDNKKIEQENLQQKNEILDLTYLKHKAGIVSDIDKLDAEQDFYQQQLQYLNALKNYGSSIVSVSKALGIGQDM
jgi:NodT family efflux transporter outer membrane factor (OMF) lipoprotein